MDEEPYRRKYGVLFRPGSWRLPPMPERWAKSWFLSGPWRAERAASWINDGGRDATMGPRDQRLFRRLFWVAAVVCVGLITWMVLD